MNHRISESDWKIWKPLFKIALDRFCERTLKKAASFAQGEEDAHARYLELYQYIKRRDKELGQVFDDFSRSKALLQIALAAKKKLLTAEELATFSPETQSLVAAIRGGGGA